MRQTIASLAKDDHTAYIQLKRKSSGKRGAGGKVKGEQGEQDEGLGLMTLSDEELKKLQVGLGLSHTYQRVIATTKALYSAENDKGSLLNSAEHIHLEENATCSPIGLGYLTKQFNSTLYTLLIQSYFKRYNIAPNWLHLRTFSRRQKAWLRSTVFCCCSKFEAQTPPQRRLDLRDLRTERRDNLWACAT